MLLVVLLTCCISCGWFWGLCRLITFTRTPVLPSFQRTHELNAALRTQCSSLSSPSSVSFPDILFDFVLKVSKRLSTTPSHIMIVLGVTHSRRCFLFTVLHCSSLFFTVLHSPDFFSSSLHITTTGAQIRLF